MIFFRLLLLGSRGTLTSGQPKYSHQWAAEALSSVGSRGTHISGQPRDSHQWAAEALMMSVLFGAQGRQENASELMRKRIGLFF